MILKKVPIYQTVVACFAFLLSVGNTIQAQNYNDSLLDGAWSGNVEKVKRAILNKADLGYTLLDSATALHYACGGNHFEVVKVLVSAGANVNAKDEIKRTPLLIAAENGNDSIGEFLVVNGASLDTRSYNGMTPLLVTVSRGYYVFTDMLLFYGANIQELADDLSGVCHLAADIGHIDLLRMLINRGAGVNGCNTTGYTPLKIAVERNDTMSMGILIRAGAVVNLPCDSTAKNKLIDFAVKQGSSDAISYLLSIPEIRSSTDLKQVRDEVIRQDDKKMVLAFRKDSIAMSWKPVFQGVMVKPELSINFRDHFFGFSLGTMEMKTKVGFEIGLAGRIWPKRVLYDFEQTGETLQLWERRGFVYFGQYKAFRFFQKHYSGLQVDAGIQETNTWARYTAMSVRPWQGWTLGPAVDVSWFGRNYSVSLGGRYFAFRDQLPKFYFSVSGGWLIHYK